MDKLFLFLPTQKASNWFQVRRYKVAGSESGMILDGISEICDRANEGQASGTCEQILKQILR